MDKTTKAFVIGACSVVILIGGGQILGRVLGKIGGELEKIEKSRQEDQRLRYRARMMVCMDPLITEYMKDFQGSSDEGWVAKTEAAKKAEAECMRKVTP